MSSTVQSLWQLSEPLHQFISSLGLTLLSALILYFFRSKVIVTWGSASSNLHRFPNPTEAGEGTAVVWTEKFYVQNTGRRPAINIEIVLNARPTSYALWKARDHTAKELAGGEFTILVPSLAPHELLIVDVLDIESKGLRLLGVNCPDTLTRQVSFLPTRQFGRPLNYAMVYLSVAGLVGSFYGIIRLVVG